MKHSWITLALAALLAALAVGIGGLGAMASFGKVSDLAKNWPHPWLLPVVVDLGIVAFNLGHFVAIRIDRPVRWLRWFALVLIAGTVTLNVQGETDTFGIVAHALPPLIYAVIVEAASALVNRASGKAPTTIPMRRWMHAPVETWIVWRTMCTEDLDYRPAVVSSRNRRLVRAEQLARYGSWRKVPSAVRLRYRLHALAPADPIVVASTAPSPRPVTRRSTTRQRPLNDASTAPVTAPSPTAPVDRYPDGDGWLPKSVTPDAWVNAGLEIHDHLTVNGRPFNRDTVGPELKARDLPAGKNEQRSELVRRVKALRTVPVAAGANGSGPSPHHEGTPS